MGLRSVELWTIPCNVKMGCQVIDKNQPIRLAEFGARAQKIVVFPHGPLTLTLQGIRMYNYAREYIPHVIPI